MGGLSNRISRAHTPADLGSSVWYFRDIGLHVFSLFNYVVKLTIVLIIGHFSASATFCKILRKYQNSVEKGKFRGSVEILQPAENCGP